MTPTTPDWYMTPSAFAAIATEVGCITADRYGLRDVCHPEDLAAHFTHTMDTVATVLTVLNQHR